MRIAKSLLIIIISKWIKEGKPTIETVEAFNKWRQNLNPSECTVTEAEFKAALPAAKKLAGQDVRNMEQKKADKEAPGSGKSKENSGGQSNKIA